ncbi:phage repressor protein [Obesumbacterium proteus]|nr:phage repressor protein [Obesumbacterium proteus]
MDFSSGGKGAIERIVKAYGFKTRQALCDHLGVSKSTMATRYMRDVFPGEWVIQCALETGTSLRWLAFGAGPMQDAEPSDLLTLPKLKLSAGKLVNDGYFVFDKAFVSESIKQPTIILDGCVTYIADMAEHVPCDGKWIIDIENNISIREVTRLPKNRIRIDNDKHSFECDINDITMVGLIKQITSYI